MKNNRNLISILILILLLAACGGDDGGNTAVNNGNEGNTSTSNGANTNASSNAGEDVTIVTFAVNEFEQGLYEGRIEAFEQANPGIRIEIVKIGEITGDSFAGFGEYSNENVIDLVKSADVIAMKPTRTMIEQKLILDLSPLMAGDSQFDASDFFPNILEQYQYGGGTWALPLTADYGVIVFDKAKFDAAGVSYPEAGWTWAEFISAAQALTNKSGESVQWGFNPGFMSPLAMIEAKAERPLIDTSTQPATINLEHPDVVAAFQWYADLAHVHGIMPTEEEGGSEAFISSDGTSSTSSDGSAAMRIEITDFMNSEQLEAENLGVVPFPVAAANSQTTPISSSYGLGNVFVVSAGSSKTDAAWTWLKFLSQQSTDSGFFDSASLPARKTAAEVSGYWDNVSESLATTLRYASEHAFNPSQVSFDSALQSIPFEIVQGQQDVQSVLAKAQESMETAVKKEADTIANATPVPSFEVAEPPSEQVPEGATVVTFVVMAGLPDTYRELAKQFQQTHPDIVVKVEEPNYFGNDFSLSGLVGEADCFQSYSSLDNPKDLQAVISVQPFIDSDPELNEADFYQAPLNAFQKQGQLMGLPGEAMIKVLAYDKRVFDAAGRSYPQPGWTMNEFLETAVALTQGSDENKTYGFKPSTFEESDLLLMMSQLGAKLVDDSADPPQTSFTNPDTIAAMRWYANLATEYGVKPPPADNSMPASPWTKGSVRSTMRQSGQKTRLASLFSLEMRVKQWNKTVATSVMCHIQQRAAVLDIRM
jgi:multiple sugar transport system substrate-binding protein